MQLISAAGHRFAGWHSDGAAPTVVFETGLGAESVEWALVAERLAPNATFYYDRLNRGDSDRVDGPRTSQEMADDLRSVLVAAHVAPPYLVVGHSFGAHVALAFAQGASDVVGVVLVEPTHPRQFKTFGPGMPEGDMRHFWTVGWRRTDTTPEHIDFPASFAETQSVTLSSVPVVVLVGDSTMASAGPDPQRLWLDLNRQWLEISQRPALQVISDSGHFIQRDRPDGVAEAIKLLLGQPV